MTGTWAEFFVAFAVFMAAHRIPTAPRSKAVLQARLGARGFTLAYSLLSTVLLIWLIVAAGRAPVVVLWDQALWQRWLVNLAMPVALGLAVFGIAAPNPLSFGGKSTGFDPDRPGIAGVLRHPLLWALALWSTAHLVVNGTLAHVLLFGSFAAFSVFGMVAIDRRNQRVMGRQRWDALAKNTSVWPFEALLAGRWHPQTGPSLWRLGAAVVIWAAVFHLHAPVIGVMPNP
ncbi:NnrU family protein [Pseudorhodobacter aquimaris]|uniref:NnrU family protein n=1 Tax=Pseudorhodobacter aquimaris TaxID=687412 RepID=UPI00067CDBFA|nr:NnrU family protein [Pseudorhodobacter aquimaris]